MASLEKPQISTNLINPQNYEKKMGKGNLTLTGSKNVSRQPKNRSNTIKQTAEIITECQSRDGNYTLHKLAKTDSTGKILSVLSSI